MEKLLLKEYQVFKTEREDIVRDGENVILKGIMQRANAKNGNGRIYERRILEREMARYQKEFIDNKQSIGSLDHYNDPEVKLSTASHIVEKLWWQNDDVCGQIRLLNTTAGKEAQALVNDGVILGISTRGLGSISEKKEGVFVNDDYQLVCWDLVLSPSTQGAYMIKENKLIKIDQDEYLGKKTPKNVRLNSILDRILK